MPLPVNTLHTAFTCDHKPSYCPSLTCWRIWTTTICTIYTGSAKGTKLTQPLGPWLPSYDETRFWHWRMLDDKHLVYRHSPMTATRVALPTLTRRTTVKFSANAPTLLPFDGPPVTPIDPTLGLIRLPVVCIQPVLHPPTKTVQYKTIQQQFRSDIPPGNASYTAHFEKPIPPTPCT